MNTIKKGFLERTTIKEKDYSKSEKKLCRKKLREFYEKCNTDYGIENNILGSRIKHIRKLKKIKITTLSKKCSIDRSTINRIENGKNKNLPWFDTICKLFFALDYDIDDFTDYLEDNERWKIIQQHKICSNGTEYYGDSISMTNVVLPEKCEINHIKAEIFKYLDADCIYYEEENKKIVIPEQYVELLRINIYNAFETLEYILKVK